VSGLRVRLFAGARDAVGATEVELDLPAGATVADLLDRLRADHPAAADLISACRVAVEREFAEAGAALPPGAEVALIPPVSGG